MSAIGQAFDTALDALRKRYLVKLESVSVELRKLIVFCEMDGLTPDLTAAAHVMAHKLAGSGQTLGFPRISEDAARLETILGDPSLDAEATAKAARALLATCRAYIEEGSAGSAPAAPPMATLEDLPPLAGPNLIAIHDDAATGRLLDDVFASHAHITTFTSVTEAVAAAHKAALIIVDLDCPGSQPNMLSALRGKSEFAGIPILALTAQRKSAAVARAIFGSDLETLMKPVTPIELDAKANAAMQRRRLSVVIGDDDRLVRELLKVRFEAQGFKAHLAHDGEDVLTLARAHNPSIIILDRDMPKLEGLIVLGMLKADAATHDIPVIVLTSKARADEITAGRKAGAADYIVKPFAPDHLLARVGTVLGLTS